MSDEIARLKAAHISELKGLVTALENITDEFKALVQYWKAEENPKESPQQKNFNELEK